MSVSVENTLRTANPDLAAPIERAVVKAIGPRSDAGSWAVKIYWPALDIKWVISVRGPDGFTWGREFLGPNEQTPEFVQSELERALVELSH